MLQHEITDEGALLDGNGSPRESGWARHPLLSYERSGAAVPLRRIKEWDTYVVLSRAYGLMVTVADNGFVGYITATVLDLVEGTELTESCSSLLPLGAFGLSASSVKGDCRVKLKRGFIDFAVMEKGARIIKIDFPFFGQGRGLRGALVLSPQPDDESMVKVTPWKKSPRTFYYNQKLNGLSAEGVLQLGTKELVFSKDEAFAVMNWGRGVWPRKGVWQWASASWLLGGKRFGFNVGFGYGDNSSATENAIFYDGKLHKLGNVTFHMNTRDWLEPWRFTSDDGRLVASLDPRMESSSSQRYLFYSGSQRQVFGTFSGRATLDDGTVLKFEGIPGFAQKARHRF